MCGRGFGVYTTQCKADGRLTNLYKKVSACFITVGQEPQWNVCVFVILSPPSLHPFSLSLPLFFSIPLFSPVSSNQIEYSVFVCRVASSTVLYTSVQYRLHTCTVNAEMMERVRKEEKRRREQERFTICTDYGGEI